MGGQKPRKGDWERPGLPARRPWPEAAPLPAASEYHRNETRMRKTGTVIRDIMVVKETMRTANLVSDR